MKLIMKWITEIERELRVQYIFTNNYYNNKICNLWRVVFVT
jgi:hypothetical protein